ncbi:putative trypsin-like serine protease precursor, partial [Conidiobolus coronatus NRRL 28638]
RIVGGNEVRPAFKYPNMVSLAYDGQHWCGGTLYNSDTIITAAHCTIEDQNRWTARIHRHDLTKTDAQENGKTYKIISREIHPQFGGQNAINDVAIWKINANRTNTHPLVSLDTGYIGFNTGELVNSIGWGIVKEGNNFTSSTLQQVQLPIFKPETCAERYVNYRRQVHPPTMICAGYESGNKDSCDGDSGGPLGVVRHGKFHLVGITSWGNGCARPGFPGVYTRVSAVVDWIK